MTQDKIPVIAVLGPTASGKTSLAIALAKEFNAEIISCDSMQIYRGMSIATAKPTPEETAQIPHHLIDFLPPEQSFSAADYVTLAAETAREIASRGKNIILCGGTGMYADAFLSGMTFSDIPGTAEKREELTRFYLKNGSAALVERLVCIDPQAAATVDLSNIKRVIRALEICECSGKPLREYNQNNLSEASPYRVLRFVLDCHDREVLYQRINTRVDRMLADGLESEARSYYRIPNVCTASQAIGYKELKPYFEGELSLEQAIDNLKRATRRYAKRQQTWFKRAEDAVHLYIDAEDCFAKAQSLCEEFLKG